MRFPIFLLGLCLASLGAGSACLLLGWSAVSALGMIGATFLLGQLLYVGLVALMLRDETRLARIPSESAPAPTAQAANQRTS